MKNIAYAFALAAGVLTLSGCCDWFRGCSSEKPVVTAENESAKADDAARMEEVAKSYPADDRSYPADDRSSEAPRNEEVASVEKDQTVAAAMPMNDLEEKAA